MREIAEIDPLDHVAVVIPCYRVKHSVLNVISEISEGVALIYVIDDACPEHTGDHVEANCHDPRVRVLRHEHNRGVGGAVKTGYLAALKDHARVIVKIDGDGQMDPSLLQDFTLPVLAGEADYTKGNRFYDLEDVRQMPPARIFGNTVLSLFNKLSSGYWDVFDPTNGYTAIHADVLLRLPLHKISDRYFFESDMLFRLGTLRAVVKDIPMEAVYADETSHLVISRVIPDFLFRHFKNVHKRLFYSYYLRDMSAASIELPLGFSLLLFGLIFGTHAWWHGAHSGLITPAGTVMLAALPVIVGTQLMLAFLNHDASAVPTRPVHKRDTRRRPATKPPRLNAKERSVISKPYPQELP